MSIVPSKSCTRCSEMKPLTDYYGDTRAKDGRKSECKVCRLAGDVEYRKGHKEATKAYGKKYYQENKDSIAAAEKKYYEKNKESIAAGRKKYYEKNKELLSTLSKKRYQENKEAYALYSKEYRKNNQDKFRVNERRRRARKIGNGFEAYTEAQVLELYGNDCHICGEAVDLDATRRVGRPGWEQGLHIEHVIALSNGGTDSLDNVKPSHGQCNLQKGSR
jgi:5-methylcytosine-specific restriction endonuclease McrA